MRKFSIRNRLRPGKFNYLHSLDLIALLEREIVSFQEPEIFAALKEQVILVTGAAGSIGSELCRQLLSYGPKAIIALDMNETGLFDLAESVHAHPNAACLQVSIGDITDMEGLTRLFAREKPGIVFHAAAYKHVPLLEQFPYQAVRTNVLGTYRLCGLAQEYGVKRFVFISTDKAAEPVNVMGASKRIGEMIVQAHARADRGTTCFCAVRFGNVIGSRGSVVPVFTRQIAEGGPITVTDPEATRYFMTIPEACGLVILTAATANKGGIYLLDMGEAVRIIDLARKMIHLQGLAENRDIQIVYTGLRPGERQHETLVADGEELTPTAYSKIFSLTSGTLVPLLPTIVEWMRTLEYSLHTEESEQLREKLFEMACKKVDCALDVVSEVADFV